jgi:hypothetical protein
MSCVCVSVSVLVPLPVPVSQSVSGFVSLFVFVLKSVCGCVWVWFCVCGFALAVEVPNVVLRVVGSNNGSTHHDEFVAAYALTPITAFSGASNDLVSKLMSSLDSRPKPKAKACL